MVVRYVDYQCNHRLKNIWICNTEIIRNDPCFGMQLIWCNKFIW